MIITLAALSLSSCKVFTKFERPTVNQAETLYGDIQTGDSLGMGDLKWRELFTDPTLQTLIEKALAQNTNMKNADLQIQEVEHALRATKLAFIPSIYFNPQGSVSKMYDPYNRSNYAYMTEGNSKTFGLPVTMGWQNVNFLTLRNQKKGAEVNLEQLRNAKQAVQAALVANVAHLYYTLSMLDEQYALTCQTRDNWRLYLDQERRLMDAGQANAAAVASIEATYYSMEQGIVTIEDNIRIIEQTLSNILGETIHHIDRNALASFQAPALMNTGAPISILSRRPDVRAAELTLASKFYDVNIARSSFYPSINLSATGSFTNSLGTVINPGMMIGNALLSLAQPIFANGRIRAQYAISKDEYEVAMNNFTNTVITAGNEVNVAMHNLKSAEEVQALIQKQVSSLETALHATTMLYEHSGANYLNVITAQNSLLSAQMQLIANRMEAISSTIELYQALGGGAE